VFVPHDEVMADMEAIIHQAELGGVRNFVC